MEAPPSSPVLKLLRPARFDAQALVEIILPTLVALAL
jgi:hypothetical protein